MPKKYMERRSNPIVDGLCDEYCLELGKDPVHRKTVANFLKRIGIKTIACKNSFPMINRLLLSQSQVKYVDIIVTRDIANLVITTTY